MQPTRSTTPTEDLDRACDLTLARLQLLRQPQSILQLSDAIDLPAALVDEALQRLVDSRTVLVSTGYVRDRENPHFVKLFRAAGVPEPAPAAQAVPPPAGGDSPAPARPRYSNGLRLDIAEGAAMAMCLREDLRMAGASDDVLHALDTAARALSRILRAELSRREVPA